MSVASEPVFGNRSLIVVLLANASAISAPRLGHQRYTVALPTPARSATASMVKSEKPFSLRTSRVLLRMARRASSLLGRPGGLFPLPLPVGETRESWRIDLP